MSVLRFVPYTHITLVFEVVICCYCMYSYFYFCLYVDNDMTRLQSQLQTVTSEVNLLQLNAQSYQDSSNASAANTGTNGSLRQQTQLIQINGLVAQDVEEMLIEERTKDIEKLNKDVVIINDLMK